MRPVGWILLGAAPFLAAAIADPGLEQALHAPTRSPANMARDAVRHPAQELAFFGLRPDATVVEIWPGGGYWTEILAPYLFGRGTYYAAVPEKTFDNPKSAYRQKLESNPGFYRKVKLTVLDDGKYDIAPAGSADFVLTFRNLHNWMEGGNADQVLAAFYRALKPGGVLGMEDHRGDPNKPQDPKAESGYVRQDVAIAMAKKAGFVFDGASEIDANPRDTKDYKEGVWTLPPTFALGAKDHAKYAAIGEADNFVLKFHKPK